MLQYFGWEINRLSGSILACLHLHSIKKKKKKKGTVAQIWISVYEIQTLVKVTDISTTPCVGYVEGRFLHISGMFFFFIHSHLKRWI